MAADEQCVQKLLQLPPACLNSIVEIAETFVAEGSRKEQWEYQLQILLRALARLGHTSEQDIAAKALRSSKTRDKSIYITYLSELPGPQSVAALAEYVEQHGQTTNEDDEEEAITEAVRTLARFEAFSKLDVVLPLIDSASASVRSAAVDFLSEMSSNTSFEALASLAARENEKEVLDRLIVALCRFKSVAAKDVIRSLSERPIVSTDSDLRRRFEEECD